MEQYITLEKKVGETPLSCVEAYRAQHPELQGVPMAYAGRLDPMASGKLLVLLGDTCKQQTDYHNLDKEYDFSVLFGIASDTHDVLGRLSTVPQHKEEMNNSTFDMQAKIASIVHLFVGPLTVPYPLFSAKTVHGKPLHMWTLEGRLAEISIPTRTSRIYELEVREIQTVPRASVVQTALKNINTIPQVTDPRKELGNDFRRNDVRADWESILKNSSLPDTYTIAYFRCTASSGTYMRTLATLIAEKCGTVGLAWHIHRTIIGTYNSQNRSWDRVF